MLTSMYYGRRYKLTFQSPCPCPSCFANPTVILQSLRGSPIHEGATIITAELGEEKYHGDEAITRICFATAMTGAVSARGGLAPLFAVVDSFFKSRYALSKTSCPGSG
jgi:hypothetical protein